LSYIGKTPAAAALTSSDISDGIIITDKLAANAVVTSKITDGTIAEADIANDAVTADKIANAVNSAIAANTSKTTNATHSGEVTGSGALTIAGNVVDEANLKVSNNPTNGYNLVARSGNTGGMTWEAPAGGGKVLQVISATKDDAFNTSSTSLTDITGLTLNITPAASSSKILIFGSISSSYRNYISTFQLVRGSTNIAIGGSSDTFRGTTSRYAEGVPNSLSLTNHSFNFLDSPSTSSQTTYKIQVKVNGGSIYINDRANGDSSYISTITAMEIGA